ATSLHRMARWPIVMRPVKPDPTPTTTRAAASPARVAMAAALAIGWRRLGISTPGPRPMRSVHSAARHNHPHVWIERWRVEEEGTAVAERLRDPRVLVALRGGGERTGKLDSHCYTSGLSSSPPRWPTVSTIFPIWSFDSMCRYASTTASKGKVLATFGLNSPLLTRS